tara:strand:+ start:112 stop:363 length:252 start_codon:yes stop_codon:yes gene_type:complete
LKITERGVGGGFFEGHAGAAFIIIPQTTQLLWRNFERYRQRAGPVVHKMSSHGGIRLLINPIFTPAAIVFKWVNQASATMGRD